MNPRLRNALVALSVVATRPVCATTNFQHVILIVQENRTPDNLFYALCLPVPRCSTSDNTKYDIQTQGWLKDGGTVNPTAVALANGYDMRHSHSDFIAMCGPNAGHTACRMDGAYQVGCDGFCSCNPLCGYAYVDNSSGILNPYLTLVTQHGWANYMFQTNQGPSFPAHQFLFGATSAPSQSYDQDGTFAAENYEVTGSPHGGCIAPPGTVVSLIDKFGSQTQHVSPCFEHQTLSDLFNGSALSWRYYTVGEAEPTFGNLWNAPVAINHICMPDTQMPACDGPLYRNNVDVTPADVLTQIQNPACTLQNLSWVTPTTENSDHALYNTGGGPDWVMNIVDAVGSSTCGYWQNTAILLTWDDWGGWYDHETPTFLPFPYSAYEYGFRVPMIFISAYTPQGYIDNNRSDFGTIARFVEYNFGFTPGLLGFADNRGDTAQRLQGFYDFGGTPRPFVSFPVKRNAAWFIHQRSSNQPPDRD